MTWTGSLRQPKHSCDGVKGDKVIAVTRVNKSAVRGLDAAVAGRTERTMIYLQDGQSIEFVSCKLPQHLTGYFVRSVEGRYKFDPYALSTRIMRCFE